MSEERLSLRQRLGTLQYTSMDRIATRWPKPLGELVFRAYGWLAFQLVPSSRAIVAENLSRVVGRPPDSDLVQAATKEAFALYARYWFDSFRVRVIPQKELQERFVMRDLDNLDRALEAGKGAIMALPHLGNWDVAAHYVCAKGYRLCAVAERLENQRVFDLFLKHREALGMKIVPLDNAARVGPQLLELLADNWPLALVADRDLTGRGVEVEMFGAPRRLPAGPALLSLTSGAPLLVSPTYTTDSGWECRIGRPLEAERSGEMRKDVTALTHAMAREFERLIAAKPTDWHMFQPAWGDDGAVGRGLSSAPPAG